MRGDGEVATVPKNLSDLVWQCILKECLVCVE